MRNLVCTLIVSIFICSAGFATPSSPCEEPLFGTALEAQVQKKFKKGFNLGVFRKWAQPMDALEPQILRALPLTVRLEAYRELFRQLHTYDYLKHIGVAYIDATGEWQDHLIQLIEADEFEAAWTQLSLYRQIPLIQRDINQAEASPMSENTREHIDLGAVDLNRFLNVYEELPPEGQSIITAFALTMSPDEAAPIVKAWLKQFRSADAAAREKLIYFNKWGAGHEDMYREIERAWAQLTPTTQQQVRAYFSERGFQSLIAD